MSQAAVAHTSHTSRMVPLARFLPSIRPVATAARLRAARSNPRQNVLGRTKACKSRLNQIDANEHCEEQPPVAYKVTERNTDQHHRASQHSNSRFCFHRQYGFFTTRIRANTIGPSCSCQRLEFGTQDSLRCHSDDGVRYVPVVEENESGNTCDSVLHGEFRSVIDVHLNKLRATGKLGCERVQHRPHRTTRSAPRRVKIHKHRLLRIQHFGSELIFCYFVDVAHVVYCIINGFAELDP